MKIFARAFIQTGLVSISTILIAKQMLFGVFIIGFILSLLWTFNVSILAFSSKKEKILYSFGAALGSVFGIIIFDFFKLTFCK